MDAVKIRCKDLMVGDWVSAGGGLPMQITNVGEDYAYATWEGNEGDHWEFDDKDDQPEPIPLTPEILEKNGWKRNKIYMDMKASDYINFSWTDKCDETLFQNRYYMCDCEYVHTLQHALRLRGLDELADNFKV